MKFISNESSWLQSNISKMANSSINVTRTLDNLSIEYSFSKTFATLVVLAYLIFFVISVLGNGIVCIAIGLRFLKPTVTNFFMGSQAACDVLIAFIIPFTVLSNLVYMYWPFGAFLCPLVSLVQLVTSLLRALTLVAMTCDKYYVLTRPFKTRLHAKHAKLLIVGIWIFSFIISLPSGVFSKIIYLPYEPGSNGLCLEVWPQDSLRHVYGVVIMFLQYFIPVVLMLASYSHIAVIVWRKKTPGEANPKRDERRERSKKKTLSMLVLVVLNYFFSWLPYHVITIVGDVNPSIYDSKTVHMLWVIAHLLSFSNGSTNVIIYFWRNRNYRMALRSIIGRMMKYFSTTQQKKSSDRRRKSTPQQNSRLTSAGSIS